MMRNNQYCRFFEEAIISHLQYITMITIHISQSYNIAMSHNMIYIINIVCCNEQAAIIMGVTFVLRVINYDYLSHAICNISQCTPVQ